MNDGLDMSRYPSAQELRRWANSRKPGVVADKGGLPRFLIVAWDRANLDRKYVKSQSHHGTERGYNEQGCRCIQCLDVGRRANRERQQTVRDERAEDDADVLS